MDSLLEENQRQRERSLSMSEIMTIMIHFHQSQYRNFKAYYTFGSCSGFSFIDPTSLDVCDNRRIPQHHVF